MSTDVNPYRYKVNLRLRHPAADPAEITQALGIDPYRSWRVGKPRCTPRGRPLEGRWPDTYWTAGLAEGEWPPTQLVDAINGLLDQLFARKDYFRRVRSEGGKVELFVSWFFEGQSGEVFNHDLLARMSDFNIDLSFDLYPPNCS